MQENTNRAIAYNSMILYAKMAIITVCALLSTRFGLKALGVVDYGLYALLGGIISIISIFNTMMVSTSNRFIAVAIGKGDVNEANKQFNVNLSIHVAIALFVILIAYPIGYWYIHRYVNYDGPLSNAMMVYCISIVGSAISFISVPYNGLLMAKEKFIVFSAVDVLSHFVRLIVSWLLIYFFVKKLLIYTITFSFLHAAPTLFYMYHCSHHFNDITKWRLVIDKKMYKSVFDFSAWVGLGALASAGKNHGAAIVVNSFFNTVMNSAMGVATSINTYVTMFAQNITQPMAPQIIKNYAAGNRNRTDELLIMSTKYSYLLTLLVGAIFLSSPNWILKIWLGEVPQYSSVFLILFIIDNLVLSLNAGIQNIIFASGKIRLYQVCSSVLNIASIVLGYFVLKAGFPAYYLIIAYICMSVVRFFAIQWALRISIMYDSHQLWKHSYLPSLMITVLFVPILFVPTLIHPILKIIVSLAYLCLLEWFIGVSKIEQSKILGFVREKFCKRPNS